MNEVTVILTSSGRWDLLRITLESFFRYNTHDIKAFHINDDSGKEIPVEFYTDFPVVKWTTGQSFKNQIKSLDYLYWLVKTSYVFQMEDDWEFIRPGFIEDSMEILERDPRILMVWLKELEDHNASPVEWVTPAVTSYPPPGPLGIFKRMPDLWAWHRFNPSLKRKADYDIIAPFSKHTIFNREKPWKSEADISQVYHKLGFTAAILPNQYIRHIGEGRHVG